jgi:type IV pilus assembly protein PilE
MRKISSKKALGFTMIELMIVVIIVSVLAALSYPAYQNYVLRSNRVEAQTALNFVAQAQEKFYSTYNRYSDDLNGAPAASGNAATGLALDPSTCVGGSADAGCKYDISVELNQDGSNYLVLAAPINSQSEDVCGTLSLDGLGNKLPAKDDAEKNANGVCW